MLYLAVRCETQFNKYIQLNVNLKQTIEKRPHQDLMLDNSL